MFTVYAGENLLDTDDSLETLLAATLRDWPTLPLGEDLAVWRNDKTIVAIVQGTSSGPRIVRIEGLPTAFVAA